MRSPGDVAAVSDLVLVGGGHSHVLVLRRFAMRPLHGVRITVVSRELHTPYSGLLPGYVAGHYGYADVHIDLGRLAAAAGARLVAAEAVNVDLNARSVQLDRHPPARFDVVSLNCGAAPGFGGPAPEHAIPVKPIGRFIPRWLALLDAVRSRAPGIPLRVIIVGGGAGGVELALSVHHALTSIAADVQVVIATAGSNLLEGHPRGVQRRFEALLPARGIDVLTQFAVEEVDGGGVGDGAGRRVAGDFVLWVTGVEAPSWLRGTGLALDADGFVAVDRMLRSISHPCVFATGDVAAMVEQPRPKSGVFAVRQSAVLAENLRRSLLGQPLRRFRAQRRALALISEGGRSATASRGRICVHGEWVWRWKDRIDRRFMSRFANLPQMGHP